MIIPLLQEYFFEDWVRSCQTLNCSSEQETKNEFPIVLSEELKEISSYTGTNDKRFSYRINPEFDPESDKLKKFFQGLMG